VPLGKPIVVGAPAELDASTAPAFRDDLGGLVAVAGAPIVVDMSEVEFLDSSGMGALVAVAKLARERGGSLSLRGVRPAVFKALRLASLVEVLDATAEPPVT
jgi:anti-sigma B factor antagonist